MRTLLLSTVVLMVASPGLAADAGKPALAAPPVQSDAVKSLQSPTVVPSPSKPGGAPVAPAPKGAPAGPAVSAPKPTPGAPVGAVAPMPKVSPGSPAVSAPAPGGPTPGPPAPTLPSAAVPGIDPKLGAVIRDASQLDRLRELKQLEQLYRDPLERGRPAGSGDEGPFSPATLGRGIGQSPGHRGPGEYVRDCLANPQDCIPGAGGTHDSRLSRGTRDGFGSGNAGDRMGGPPTLGGLLDGARGPVADGPKGHDDRDNLERATAQLGERRMTTTVGDPGDPEGSGGMLSTYEKGEVDTTWSHHGDHSWSRTTVRDSEGRTTYELTVLRSSDGTVVSLESGGSLETGVWMVHNRVTVDGRSEVRKVFVPPPRSQPREDPVAGSGRDDGCSWAPLHGCLNPREDVRTSIRERTSQPGPDPDAEGTEGGSGSSRGGSPGPAAVTNTGDGSFVTERQGGGGQGMPVWETAVDPPRPVPGGRDPGSALRRAGSDAGVDAGTGAIPAPPPPPR